MERCKFVHGENVSTWAKYFRVSRGFMALHHKCTDMRGERIQLYCSCTSDTNDQNSTCIYFLNWVDSELLKLVIPMCVGQKWTFNHDFNQHGREVLKLPRGKMDVWACPFPRQLGHFMCWRKILRYNRKLPNSYWVDLVARLCLSIAVKKVKNALSTSIINISL